MYGWVGKILRLNLTDGRTSSVDTMRYAKDYLGGKGINTKVLFDEVSPKTKPFDPKNRLIFGTGPLTGTLAPSSGRCSITTKSPLTGIFGDTNVGAYWGPKLKYAGYDGIIIEGKASQPVYLWIDDGKVEIRDASGHWGKDTWETQSNIKEELGHPEIQTVCIGPAGEKLVRFASIVTGTSDAAARTGAGAVMGSKNLKAIAVNGSMGVNIARPDEFKDICYGVQNAIRESPIWESFGRGMSDAFRMYIASGTLSYGYHDASVPPGFDLDSFPEEMDEFTEKYKLRNVGCFSCPLRCQAAHYVPEIGVVNLTCESWQQFLTFSKVLDFKFTLHAYIMLQKYGMDVFSTAATIAFVIDLFEKGIISKKDTGGLELAFGNKDIFLTLIERIADRDGFGALLAEGTYAVANKIGGNAKEHARTVKRLELPDYSFSEPGYALGTAGSERGGWLRSYGLPITLAGTSPEQGRSVLKELLGTKDLPDVDYEWMPQVLSYFEHVEGAADLLGICKWITTWMLAMPVDLKTMSSLLSAATGIDLEEKGLETYVDRQKNVCRAFNVREGITRKDDRPPAHYFRAPKGKITPNGGELDRAKFEKMLSEYYRLKGWDVKTGIPTRKRLEHLGLKDVADSIKEL